MRFAVFGLPRSGTTWAANWLTDAGALCLHDPIADHAPAELLRLDLGRPWGVSCTGLWAFEDVARQVAQRCPVVVLERDPAASDAALCRLGMSALPGWLHDRFRSAPGVRLPFDALWREEGARLIWSILRPDAPFDVRRWRLLRDIRVEPILDRLSVCGGTVVALREEFQREGAGHGKETAAAS